MRAQHDRRSVGLDLGAVRFEGGLVGLQVLGDRDLRHRRGSMVRPALAALERGGAGEDLPLLLQGDNPAVGEAAAVEAALDTVVDVEVFAAAAQEISMERVGRAVLGHRRLRGHQRLGDHLPAEHPADAVLAARAFETVLAERLEVEHPQEIGDEFFGCRFSHRWRLQKSPVRRQPDGASEVSRNRQTPAWAASAASSSSATMLVILIIGFTAGPAVSLYGSPTVSPVTAALWASEPLPP